MTYSNHPTPTGTLDRCDQCGALVGDRKAHDRWHLQQIEVRRR